MSPQHRKAAGSAPPVRRQHPPRATALSTHPHCTQLEHCSPHTPRHRAPTVTASCQRCEGCDSLVPAAGRRALGGTGRAPSLRGRRSSCRLLF